MSEIDPFLGYPTAVAAAEAVAAVNAWRQWQSVAQLTPLPLSSTSFVAFATLNTTALAAGTYEITVSALASGSNSGTQIEMRVFIDTVDVFASGPRFPFGVSTAVQNFSATLPVALADGVHVIELKASQPTSPGTAQMDSGGIILERKA